jgi:MFS family permease
MEIVGGLLMTLDNIVAVLLQPYFGQLSDRLQSRYGRRTPFFMIAVPACFCCLVVLPFVPLLVFIAVILVFNFAMAFYRTPIMSLMPDTVPPHQRSSANSFIALMGGVGTIIGMLIPTIVSLIPGTDPVEVGNFVAQDFWGFFFTGLMMVVCLVIFRLTIKETPTGPGFFHVGDHPVRVDVITQEIIEAPVAASPEEVDEATTAWATMKEIARSDEKSMLWFCVTIFCYFFGFNALEYSFGRYAVSALGITEGEAGMILAILPVALILTAVWAGRSGERIGRLKTMKIGMWGMIVPTIFVILFLQTLDTTGGVTIVALLPLILLISVAGIGYGFTNINALPVVWQLAPEDKIGVYTGIYYLVSALAAILSPPVMSTIYAIWRTLGWNQWATLFPFFLLSVAASRVFIQFVKKGDAELTPEQLAKLRAKYAGED